MQRTLPKFILLAILALAACQPAQTEPPAASPASAATSAPVATEAALQATATLPEQVATDIFDIAWDDRSIFNSVLIDSEQSVLDTMPGASVYHISMTINDDMMSLSGREQVRYTNQEDVALEEVYFRLFPNIFAGSTEISNLTVDGSAVEAEYELRDSAMRVPLSEALSPGESVVIDMDFAVDVPNLEGSNYGMFAFEDEVLALAHFYPIIAVYDDEGWNIEIPPAQGDVIYADSSFYIVQITAPSEQVILTSGSEVSREDAGNKQVLTVAAGPMRDFYIASSANYTVVSQTVGQTTINSYSTIEFRDSARLTLNYATESVRSFNERYGVYPFVEFDLATTPNLALGIEYPGIVVINSRVYDPRADFGGTPAPVILEATVAHETAHQWFYSLVGNDQLDEPWLDEAFAQYLTGVYYTDQYGARNAQGYKGSWAGRWGRVDGADIPIGLPVGDYQDAEYGAIIYGRGPIFVETLAEQMGEETFDQFMKDYFQTYEWGIATTDTLKQMAEQHCACDLTSLFEEWVFAKE